MISDLSYRQNYDLESNFLNVTIPFKLSEDDSEEVVEQKIYKTYHSYCNNDPLPKDEYFAYESNIVFQRHIYGAMDKWLPISNQNTISLFYLINSLLLAAVLAYLLFWIKTMTNNFVSFGLLILISFFSSQLTMYGDNLYWIGWSLFIPICSSILLIQNNKLIENKHFKLIVFVFAFCVCFFKQLLYFEFLSTVVIAMIVPYFYYFIVNKQSIKKSIQIIIFSGLGAGLSFFVILIIKTYMLSEFSNGIIFEIKNLFGFIINRTTGSANGNSIVYETSILQSLSIMAFNKHSFSFFNKVLINNFQLCLITGFAVLSSISICIKDKNFIRENIAWISMLIVSFFAPLSWFIIFKAHTLIHNIQCSVLWYIPFSIIAAAYILYIISKIYKQIAFATIKDN